ncbi:MAG: DUF362 domain-containing protein [Clostridia bacterium]
MTASKVYFTDMRTGTDNSLLDKLARLLKKAGIFEMPLENQYVAIKIHFGEPGNLAFLRPNFARVVVDLVKAGGGKPFLTDCNTLYVGGRKNALDHLETAQLNGYSPLTTGCHVLIADGLKGLDEAIVPLSGTKYVTQAKIGRAIMDADIVISLNHFKGHEITGFGGALKNLGMGCGSRAGKMEQHCSGKPEIIADNCRGCKMCSRQCAQDAISYGTNKKAVIDYNRCVGCGRCIGACNFDAIENNTDSGNHILCEKMVEYALAVVQGRPNFHINIVNQVSPFCDCHGENDTAIIPDVGMFASFDPVALDAACADACNRQPVLPGSYLSDQLAACGDAHHDHFTNAFPTTDWRVMLHHAEEIGVGQMAYELITVK